MVHINHIGYHFSDMGRVCEHFANWALSRWGPLPVAILQEDLHTLTRALAIILSNREQQQYLMR